MSMQHPYELRPDRAPGTPLPWMDWAACADADPDALYPEPGDFEGIRLAKLICRACPVAQTCLEDELRLPATRQHGVRGGKTARERIKMLRERAA